MKSELKVKVLAFAITAIVCTIGIIKNTTMDLRQVNTEYYQVLAMESMATYDIDADLDSLIDNNKETFEFYTKMFGIKLSDLKESIIRDNGDKRLNHNDIGNTDSDYETLDKNLIDYLLNLKEKNPKLFNQEYVSGTTYSKEYIYGLIDYFASFYSNVDAKTLKAIAYIESGNLNSNYMVKNNNIYGGMASNGLIKYKNIEYGVLSYVKMMSKGYYGKGLTTIDKIAKKYNLGSKTWISNVKSALKRVSDTNEDININTLTSLI